MSWFYEATQTLGEEYTGIWLHSSRPAGLPSQRLRAALILLPTLPTYLVARWGSSVPQGTRLHTVLHKVPTLLEVLSEINLAVFYLRGTYYSLAKRVLGIRYVRQFPGLQPCPSVHFVDVCAYDRYLRHLRIQIHDHHLILCWGFCWALDSFIDW